MSASSNRSNSSVRTGARAAVFVVTEIVAVLFKITDSYGLHRGTLTGRPESISRALMVWLSAKQLTFVLLEIMDKRGKLIRKFEMSIDYRVPNEDDESFQTYLESLDDFLKSDKPEDVGSYRVVCDMNTDNPIKVEGWQSTTLKDASHLTNKRLSDEFVRSKHFQVGMSVYF